MSRLPLTGLTFRPATPKHRRVKKDNTIRQKLYCVCIEEEPNKFKGYININNPNQECPDTLVLPFSPRSYNLKGKIKVFTINERDSRGLPICVLRSETEANNFPGLDTQYTPFRNNYVYSGYIVTINDIHFFDVDNVFDNVTYCNHLISNVQTTN